MMVKPKMYDMMTKSMFGLMTSIFVVSTSIVPYATAQQSGYSLTVNVPSHPFGKDSVHISVQTENGYNTYQWVSTAGNVTWIFDIPPNEGNSVKVYAATDSALILLGLDHCQMFSLTPSDQSDPHYTVSIDSN